MKKITKILIASLLLFNVVACSNQDTSEIYSSNSESVETVSYSSYTDIFDSSKVVDINIEIAEEDLEEMFENAMDEEYYSATITMDGVTLENVGIRTKGASSLSSVAKSDSDRYGFKIKTDEYVDDQTLLGLDKFVLNASFSDPSYMREYLTYQTANYLGLNTPDLVYTNVYFNGELFGFYLAIEAYDDTFVDEITSDDDAVLYKADSESNTLKTSDDTSGFEVKEGDDDGNENIKNLIDVLNNTSEENTDELEAILDIDSVLKNAAINNIMGNYDSYSGSKAHNYYLLYHDGQFEYLAWDYNMSIGGFPQDNGNSVNVDVEEPYYSTSASERPLISKLLEIDKYNDKYLEYVQELLDYLGDFENQVDDVSSLISTYVEADPTSFYDYSTYLENISASDTDLLAQASQSTSITDRPQMTQDRPTTQNNEEIQTAIQALIDQGIDPKNLTDAEIQDLIEDGTLPEDFTLLPIDGNNQQGLNNQVKPDNQINEDDQTAIQALIDQGIDPKNLTDAEIQDLIEDGTLPEDFTLSPQGGQEARPDFAQGQNMNDNQQSKDTVSIIDYINQRISFVSNQLQD